MPRVGQEIKRANGFTLRIDVLDEDLLEMEARYRGDEGLPQAHFHPHQDEHFEVLEGRVHAVVDGEERFYEAGERFDVPAGATHQMTGVGPTRTRWQVRPALRTAEFLERLYDALDNGFPDGVTGERFMAEYNDVFRLPGPTDR